MIHDFMWNNNPLYNEFLKRATCDDDSSIQRRNPIASHKTLLARKERKRKKKIARANRNRR